MKNVLDKFVKLNVRLIRVDPERKKTFMSHKIIIFIKNANVFQFR